MEAVCPGPPNACIIPPANQKRLPCARNTRIGPTKPSVRPFARFSCMPEPNLFLMFTQRLNTLGVAHNSQRRYTMMRESLSPINIVDKPKDASLQSAGDVIWPTKQNQGASRKLNCC